VYFLYLDESGNPDDEADRHFVLGGVAVFERQTFFLARKLDEIQRRHFPGTPPIEFHASVMRSGRGFWRDVPREKRDTVVQDVATAIGGVQPPGLALFAVAVEKSSTLYGIDAVKRATEEICRRFDIFLMRRRNEANDKQRGLLVFAEGRFHQRGRVWVRGFRDLGTRWGVLKNLADIPYFASTRETRMLQAADFVSHATYLLYERRDPSLLEKFIHRFDHKEGTLHGLVHLFRNSQCDCPACVSRKTPGELGPWGTWPKIH